MIIDRYFQNCSPIYKNQKSYARKKYFHLNKDYSCPSSPDSPMYNLKTNLFKFFFLTTWFEYTNNPPRSSSSNQINNEITSFDLSSSRRTLVLAFRRGCTPHPFARRCDYVWIHCWLGHKCVSQRTNTFSLSLSLPPHSHFLVRLPRGRRATHKTTAVWLVPSRDNAAWRNWILVWKMVIVRSRCARLEITFSLDYFTRTVFFVLLYRGRGRRRRKKKRDGR